LFFQRITRHWGDSGYSQLPGSLPIKGKVR
jgi:hypothetical protein